MKSLVDTIKIRKGAADFSVAPVETSFPITWSHRMESLLLAIDFMKELQEGAFKSKRVCTFRDTHLERKPMVTMEAMFKVQVPRSQDDRYHGAPAGREVYVPIEGIKPSRTIRDLVRDSSLCHEGSPQISKLVA